MTYHTGKLMETGAGSEPAVELAPPAESLVDRIMAEVTDYIRANGLEPGAMLPSEATFAAKVGASRAVAREGFRGLAALRLIDVGNGRRARVAPADESVVSLMMDHAVHTKQITVQQILDVRRTIELRTVALAALRRTDAEAAAIVELASEMARKFDRPAEVMAGAVSSHIHDTLASRLIGKDPLRIEALHKDLVNLPTAQSSTGAEYRAASGVDIALWDLWGRATNQPVHQLLGGLCRDKLRIYNTCAGYQ